MLLASWTVVAAPYCCTSHRVSDQSFCVCLLLFAGLTQQAGARLSASTVPGICNQWQAPAQDLVKGKLWMLLYLLAYATPFTAPPACQPHHNILLSRGCCLPASTPATVWQAQPAHCQPHHLLVLLPTLLHVNALPEDASAVVGPCSSVLGLYWTPSLVCRHP
jgi:hypothetical protein